MKSKSTKPDLKYNPQEIESKWQKYWEENKTYQPDLDSSGKPFYNLMMFPYPSAEGMHVGNMYAFTGSDVYGRFKRMQGNDVFEPIGLDGFGIHSENYALKVGRHPRQQAKKSQENFYRQLRVIGNGFDWSAKLETYDPQYYKWTQWIFIQLFKKGLAYRKKATVNFCPQDKTVLADEQVVAGCCERCGTEVVKKDLEQWFFKITDYAERLLNNIDRLDWSEKVKIAQRQWIGRSEGLIFTAPVKGSDLKIQTFSAHFEAFCADTFVVIAPDHTFLKKLIEDAPNKKEILEFSQKIINKRAQKGYTEEKEPEGIFIGKYIIDPVGNGDLPIWVASYALREYGTGIVKCSVHDGRDFEFAKKYGIKLKPVLFPKDLALKKKVENLEICYTDMVNGYLSEPSEFAGKRAGSVRKEILDYVQGKEYAVPEIQYHLRDWLISRQRYWGPPIPMINCPKCGWQPVAEKDLPVLLPDVKDWKPKGIHSTSSGQAVESPLASVESFVKTKCRNCGADARRETDVSDTFLDSAWYFFRYTSTDVKTLAWDSNRAKKWLPVDMYIGGAEHSVLHLLYSRFITMIFKDLGLISFEEPYAKFRAHGLLIKEGAKMSKSRGNVVIPDEYIKKFGADTLRMYLMFLGPFILGGDFYDTGIEGMHRFVKRIWTLFTRISNSKFPISNESQRVMHKTIKKVTEDIENLRYNTAIAGLMEYYNFLSKQESISKEEIKTLLLLIAPFAPHFTEELWIRIKEKSSIHASQWPSYNPKFLTESEVTIIVQINGKIRDTLRASLEKSENQQLIEKLAKKSRKIKKYLNDRKIKKVVYVKDRVINFVVV